MSARMPWSRQGAGGARADRGDGGVGQGPRVAPGGGERFEQEPSPIRARQAHERVGMDRARPPSRTSPESIRGTIRIAGSSITSAPSAASVAARPLACARALVTTTRRPKRGRFSSQAIVSRRAATAPVRMIDGGPIAASAAAAGSSREARGHRALRGHGPVLHGGRGLLPVSAGGDQALGDLRQSLQPHVHHERAREGRKRVPVERRVVLGGILVSGDEGDGGRLVPVGHRDPGVRRRRHPGRDAGDHLERDPGGGERLCLLTAAPEDERIAALQADDGATGPRAIDHQPLDLLLRHLGRARLLAHVHELGVRASPRHCRLRDQAVVEHGVGAGDELRRPQRHQPWVAGPGADEVDDARTGGASRRLLDPPQDRSRSGRQHPLGEGLAEGRRLLAGRPRRGPAPNRRRREGRRSPNIARLPSPRRAQTPTGVWQVASSASDRSALRGQLDQGIVVRDRAPPRRRPRCPRVAPRARASPGLRPGSARRSRSETRSRNPGPAGAGRRRRARSPS